MAPATPQLTEKIEALVAKEMDPLPDDKCFEYAANWIPISENVDDPPVAWVILRYLEVKRTISKGNAATFHNSPLFGLVHTLSDSDDTIIQSCARNLLKQYQHSILSSRNTSGEPGAESTLMPSPKAITHSELDSSSQQTLEKTKGKAALGPATSNDTISNGKKVLGNDLYGNGAKNESFLDNFAEKLKSYKGKERDIEQGEAASNNERESEKSICDTKALDVEGVISTGVQGIGMTNDGKVNLQESPRASETSSALAVAADHAFKDIIKRSSEAELKTGSPNPVPQKQLHLTDISAKAANGKAVLETLGELFTWMQKNGQIDEPSSRKLADSLEHVSDIIGQLTEDLVLTKSSSEVLSLCLNRLCLIQVDMLERKKELEKMDSRIAELAKRPLPADLRNAEQAKALAEALYQIARNKNAENEQKVLLLQNQVREKDALLDRVDPTLPGKFATLQKKHQGKLEDIERLKESLHDLKQNAAQGRLELIQRRNSEIQQRQKLEQQKTSLEKEMINLRVAAAMSSRQQEEVASIEKEKELAVQDRDYWKNLCDQKDEEILVLRDENYDLQKAISSDPQPEAGPEVAPPPPPPAEAREPAARDENYRRWVVRRDATAQLEKVEKGRDDNQKELERVQEEIRQHQMFLDLRPSSSTGRK